MDCALGTMLAAVLVAADCGRKLSGWGFVLFCIVAVTWIVSGLTSDAVPIAVMNVILLSARSERKTISPLGRC